MKIISWNVNGVRSISKKGFLEWVKKESPDILCLQETKAFPEQLDETILDPGGYYSFWNNPTRKGYAGVSIYSKKKPVSAESDIPSGRLDTEGRILTLNYKSCTLMNIYFPNGGASPERLKYKLNFYEKFLEYLKKQKKKNLIICGDFNTAHREIDLARPKQNQMFSGFLPEERAWMDKFVKAGYVDTFRHFNAEPDNYTWWDYKTSSRKRNVGWRIDYFFVTKSILKKVKKAFIMPEVMGSDHCPVGIEL